MQSLVSAAIYLKKKKHIQKMPFFWFSVEINENKCEEPPKGGV